MECRESSFVTGVWDGDFEGEGFDTSEVFFGTGAKLTKNGIDFVTPSHSLEDNACIKERPYLKGRY